MIRLLLFICTSTLFISIKAQELTYKIIHDIPYYPEKVVDNDAYIAERCVLDFYYPEGIQDFPVVVWFHGGGLTGGERYFPNGLTDKGIAIVAPGYRLYPQVKSPEYIKDAAAAIAWVFENIEEYGGDSSLVFLSGHSAGGYLASMTGLDKKWLQHHNIDANRIAGIIPFSGHCITHFTVREERGIKGTQPVIDDLAPLFYVRDDAPPLLLITGDRELEMLGRYEENSYMMRMMKVAGHKETRLIELQGYGHNMEAPAVPLLLKEVERICRIKRSKN